MYLQLLRLVLCRCSVLLGRGPGAVTADGEYLPFLYITSSFPVLRIMLYHICISAPILACLVCSGICVIYVWYVLAALANLVRHDMNVVSGGGTGDLVPGVSGWALRTKVAPPYQGWSIVPTWRCLYQLGHLGTPPRYATLIRLVIRHGMFRYIPVR